MNPRVTTELDGRGVLTVTLDDPDNRNALSRSLVAEFVAACRRADGDPAVRVVVVTNTGRVFCAGADLAERSAGEGDPGPDEVPDPAELFARIRRSPKPYVGRIAGHAVAGGMGLAAAMDLSVAVRGARFGFTEVRVGVAPAMISVICLPKMSAADAAEVFLRGRRFDADEAVRLGLFNRAADPGELDAAVEEIVTDLLAGGPRALAATKSLLTRVPAMAFDEAMAWTAEMSARLFAGEEAAAGMAAFLARRPPPWVPDGSSGAGRSDGSGTDAD